MRLLGGVRLSRDTDDTTSPERQREQLELTARARGDTLVHVAEDIDVSGAVDPFRREHLGPWLTDPAKIGRWDGLIVAKLDRLTRSLLDFQELLKWCDAHSKVIISVSEGFDLSTPIGRMIANILVMFAQFERERMAERRKESKDKLDQGGKWNGGTVHTGYRPEKSPDGGWNLVPDPITASIVRRMADDILAGKSAQSIARELHSQGVPTGQGGQWRSSSVIKILRSPILKGYVVACGEVVRGPDGMPVKREPILSDEIWAKVQAALDKSSKELPARPDAAMLLRVAYCACGQPLYMQRKSTRPHAYYHCASITASHQPCPHRTWLRSDLLEEFVVDNLLDAVGGVPYLEKIVRPAVDHTAEIAEVDEAITNLLDLAEQGMFKGDRQRLFNDRMTDLETRRANLEALPSHDEQVDWKETGQTFAKHFDSLTDPQRRQFLVSAGIRAYVEPVAEGDAEEELLPSPHLWGHGRTVVGWLENRKSTWRVTIHLGDLAILRDLASTSTP
jgi:site-specific DNA recombinase